MARTYSQSKNWLCHLQCAFVSSAISRIGFDAVCRCYALVGLFAIFPGAHGAPTPTPGYTLLDGPASSYLEFEATPSNETSAITDANYFLDSNVLFSAWRNRAQKIRLTHNVAYCTGNLSVALDAVGAAYQASSNASTTLLTLLPTAGALIGAPAKELWVLSRLVPIAGFLSMALSLGGNIVPHQVSDYASLEDFSYNGMKNNSSVDFMLKRRASGKSWSEADIPELSAEEVIEHFAAQVHARAMNVRTSAKKMKVILGVGILCVLILLICFACWLLAQGSIIVWWCTANAWTFTWYGVTVITSVFENYANAPFVKSWELRVSRAPPQLRVSHDAPWVCAADPDELCSNSDDQSLSNSPNMGRTDSTTSSLLISEKSKASIFHSLKQRFTTTGHVILPSGTTFSRTTDAFYVIVSQEGTTYTTTFLRLFAKTLSVAAFTMSTALFASSTLVTIQPAVIVMTIILASGIFGRVTAMWISAVIMRDRPVLHRVVRSEEEAAMFVAAVLGEKGLICEIEGLVVVDGRIVGTASKWSWRCLAGVLAKPFDVRRVATKAAV